MTKSYKVLVVSALLDADALTGRVLRIEELVRRVRDVASRKPRLLEDRGPDANAERALRTVLERNPIAAWTGGKGTGGAAIFSYADDWFRFLADVAPEDANESCEGDRPVTVRWNLEEPVPTRLWSFVGVPA
ncbi:hypothetical protein A2cp1_4004 [Anaeromyxobacter dehalogenans 2CP-1]|uniref:Uncharacterized protein n=1 Tax=Anaeromyxobacter dehalogenans (strain ATCC BAA-258 / DSM 21875 / 2CP-1) TaxID=455488 RepID=B8J8N9_ANAD2|nr:hypothetical protein [Anaeromyxobacter dehalogenans]ACL67325.1 hypothetical protein A2cp1_4004 [Anaeromyxobacter dehalogenans 2CP-1]